MRDSELGSRVGIKGMCLRAEAGTDRGRLALGGWAQRPCGWSCPVSVRAQGL